VSASASLVASAVSFTTSAVGLSVKEAVSVAASLLETAGLLLEHAAVPTSANETRPRMARVMDMATFLRAEPGERLLSVSIHRNERPRHPTKVVRGVERSS